MIHLFQRMLMLTRGALWVGCVRVKLFPRKKKTKQRIFSRCRSSLQQMLGKVMLKSLPGNLCLAPREPGQETKGLEQVERMKRLLLTGLGGISSSEQGKCGQCF